MQELVLWDDAATVFTLSVVLIPEDVCVCCLYGAAVTKSGYSYSYSLLLQFILAAITNSCGQSKQTGGST